MRWIKKFENVDGGKYEDYFIDLSDNWNVEIGSRIVKNLLTITISILDKDLIDSFPIVEPDLSSDMIVTYHRNSKRTRYFELMMDIHKCISHLESSLNITYASMFEETRDVYSISRESIIPGKISIIFNL